MKRYLPSLMWSVALAALYFMDAGSTVSFCFFKWLGLSYCPGCGIGHSIHSTLHFRFAEAFHYHVLGIPATIVLLWHIIKPLIIKHTSYEPTNVYDARS
jgi:hypothetical protein